MGLLRSLFIVTLPFYIIFQKTSGTENEIFLNDEKTVPLAIIIKESVLTPAVPKEYVWSDDMVTYNYDEELGEKFVTACPAPNKQLTSSEKQWLEQNLSNEGTMLTVGLDKYDQKNCHSKVKPSIRKTGTTCSLSAEFYEIGYPVSNEDGEDIKFVSIYKICYSVTEGTLYSIHSIASPKLMPWQIQRYYARARDQYLNSKLDDFLNNKLNQLQENYYLYDFVPEYDMPVIRTWRLATFFLFNYIPIPPSKYLLIGMSKYDDYIRWFSRETGKKLTLYSGVHEHTGTITETTTSFCILTKTCEVNILVKSFWRIIMDSERSAAMIVTQYEPARCKAKNLICPNEDNFIYLEKYPYGGCTYQCRVDENMLILLGLPKMTIERSLSLIVPRDKEAKNPNAGGESNSSSQNNIQIDNLAQYDTFIGAMLVLDSMYANQMIEAGLAENVAEGGNGHADGHADGHAVGHADGHGNGPAGNAEGSDG